MFGFGRTKEEPPPQSRVAGTSQQVSGETPPVVLSGDREDRGEKVRLGPREGWIILLFAMATLGASAYVLIGEEQEALDDPAEKAARGEISAFDDLSLLREENVQRVLDDVEGSDKPLITSLRISPTRIDVTVRDTDGIREIVSYDASFDTEDSDFGVGEDEALRPDQIDASVPEEFARKVIERTGQPDDAVDYVTRSGTADRDAAWYLALDKGPARDRQWVAAANGRDIRKPGDPSAAQRAAQRRYAAERRAYEAEQRRLQKIYDKRSACLESASDSEAVSRCISKFEP